MKNRILNLFTTACLLSLTAGLAQQQPLTTLEAVEMALKTCRNCSGFEVELQMSPGDLASLLREIRDPSFIEDELLFAGEERRFSQLAKTLLDLANSTSSSVISREAVETTLAVTREGQRRNPQPEYVPFTHWDARWGGPCDWSNPFARLSSENFALAVDVVSPVDPSRYLGASASHWTSYGTCLMTFFYRFPSEAPEYVSVLLERDNAWLLYRVAHELGASAFGAALQTLLRDVPEFFDYQLIQMGDAFAARSVMDLLAQRMFETENSGALPQLRAAFVDGLWRVEIASAGKRFSRELRPIDDVFWMTADTVPYMGHAFAESPSLVGYCSYEYPPDTVVRASSNFDLAQLREALDGMSANEIQVLAHEWEGYFKGLTHRVLEADDFAVAELIRCADFLLAMAPLAEGARFDFEILAGDPLLRELLSRAAWLRISEDQIEAFLGFVDTVAGF